MKQPEEINLKVSLKSFTLWTVCANFQPCSH